mmetsp:Transcript_10369/g.14383  ORF Transcript_10369/g.14383 Transcript_10369/m.14383 type:complete len:359 (+) Transcript_10369:266-1342(+)|eukprot:CAMPEP_0184484058 /NCGR_PEP_ID=MMETSP0113_2-20130426/5755_1 /TAXON_ID=91329 /ORGANISM="Norrisiella sphaerica, Strain BC52" /LENGTH=358 /DNA_ID=CAMNT_0026864831 /DNA_START=262 /DNA_END=1338 /DNA_ORIENTATION=+
MVATRSQRLKRKTEEGKQDGHELAKKKVSRVSRRREAEKKNGGVPSGDELLRFAKAIDESFPSTTNQSWEGPFMFAQLADTQLGCLTFNKSLEKELAIVRKGVEKINSLKPKFVIVCGDMINAFPSEAKLQDEQIKAFYKAMNGIDKRIPLVCVCGNHDIGNQPDRSTIRRYTKYFGPDFFTFWVGGVKCIVINSSLYKDPSKAKDLAKEHDKWLMQELKKCEKEKPQHTLVFAHIPPFINAPDEPNGYFNWSSDTRKRVLGAMKKAKVRTMFCGHYHRNAGGCDGPLEVVVTSALGCTLKALEDPLNLPVVLTDPPLGENVSGFRLVRVTKKDVEHKWFVLEKLPKKCSVSSPIWNT